MKPTKYNLFDNLAESSFEDEEEEEDTDKKVKKLLECTSSKRKRNPKNGKDPVDEGRCQDNGSRNKQRV